MKHAEILFKTLAENNGIITTAQARALGIRKNIFNELLSQGRLVKIATGLYALPNADIDEYLYFQHRLPQGVFSHDTAAYLHGLVTRMPLTYTMMVKSGTNVSRIAEKGSTIIFRYIQPQLLDIGKTSIFTPFNSQVNVYDKERTILDVIKDKDKMDSEIVNQALNNYFKSEDKNLFKLSQYAIQLKRETLLRHYTEILL